MPSHRPLKPPHGSPLRSSCRRSFPAAQRQQPLAPAPCSPLRQRLLAAMLDGLPRARLNTVFSPLPLAPSQQRARQLGCNFSRPHPLPKGCAALCPRDPSFHPSAPHAPCTPPQQRFRLLGYNYFRLHPKGRGVVCVRPGGVAPFTFVQEYLGQLHSGEGRGLGSMTAYCLIGRQRRGSCGRPLCGRSASGSCAAVGRRGAA